MTFGKLVGISMCRNYTFEKLATTPNSGLSQKKNPDPELKQ